MNIVVCIKQVPDTAEVKINPETNTLIRDGVENIMNPFDRQALETALILKDTSGAKVTVVSMGPPQATDILKEAIAMGADDAVLISDRALAGSDTLATSVALAAAVRKVGECDLVLCGKQAIDGDTAQVGPEMAEHLGDEKNSVAGNNSGNSRNGYGKKTIISDYGECEIAVPRDRNGDFEPKVIEKRQTRTDEIEQKIMQILYAG